MHVHVDVDNVWILEQEYGVASGVGRDAIFDDALPRFLSLFAAAGVKATFFIVGSDLALASCRRFCEMAAAAGHELANHTESHLPDLAGRSFAEKEREITTTHEQLCGILNSPPIGFRAPGYYIDDQLLSVLERLGYRYDTSVLPGPACLLMTHYLSRTSPAAKNKTYGRGRYLVAPRKPRSLARRTRAQTGDMIELPISVDPLTRLPIHSTFAYKLGLPMIMRVLRALRREPGPHVYLFHAVDLLAYPAGGALTQSVIPLQRPLTARIELVTALLSAIVLDFEVLTTREFVEASPPGAFPRSRFYGRLAPLAPVT